MIEIDFKVFEGSDNLKNVRTKNVVILDDVTKTEVECDAKENIDGRVESNISGKETTSIFNATVPAIETISVISIDTTRVLSDPQKSGKNCSSSSYQSVPSVLTKGQTEKAMTGTAQISALTCSDSAVETHVEYGDSIENIVEGKVSLMKCSKDPVVQSLGRKNICSALARTIPKRNLNPAKCLDIIDRIYDNYYDLEAVYTAKPYLENQKDINAKMRAILIDWIVEVHYKFKLQQATLWLCVNIIDRFLESTPTVRSDLQLVGVSALLIACKFEEIYPPEVRDCIYITDYAYTREQVLAMESKILCQLDYHICVPTGYHFMIRYLNSFDTTDQVKYLSFYYAERNLQEYDMLDMRPNKFAATALYAALSFRPSVQQDNPQAGHPPDNPWTAELETLTGFSKADLIFGACNILRHVQEETVTASKRQLIAAKKKYAADKYNAISTLPVPQLAHQLIPVPVGSF